MYGILLAIEDGNARLFCFASVEDAMRFKEFVEIYMDEGGSCSSGVYYWVDRDASVVTSPIIPPKAQCELKQNLVRDMLCDILRARTAGLMAISDSLIIDLRGGAIVFEYGELPARLRPTVGDMFRVVKSIASNEELTVGDGRVIEDNGETLRVISWWDEDDAGDPKPDVKFVEVRTSAVMKISDWPAKNRETMKCIMHTVHN